MSSPLTLSSLQNPRVKGLVRLRDKKERLLTGQFLVEGRREIERAVAAGFVVEDLYLCTELGIDLGALAGIQAEVTYVTRPVFEKIAVRDNVDGLLAVMRAKAWAWDDLFRPGKIPLLVVCEAMEKPGNLGALLRTMDAVGASGLVTVGTSCDPYHPHTVRASVGAAFTIPHMSSSLDEFIERCRTHQVTLIGAALTPSSEEFYSMNLTEPVALCLGTEAHGLTQEFMDRCDRIAKIPMLGTVDSLNVSVSGAVMLYEALRQRIVAPA